MHVHKKLGAVAATAAAALLATAGSAAAHHPEVGSVTVPNAVGGEGTATS
jgi:hypothetical protein